MLNSFYIVVIISLTCSESSWPECCLWPRPRGPPSIPQIASGVPRSSPHTASGLNEILMSLIWKLTPRICSLAPCCHAGSPGGLGQKRLDFGQNKAGTQHHQEPVLMFASRIKILPRPDNRHWLAVSRPCLRIANCIVRKICNLGLNVGRWGHWWISTPWVRGVAEFYESSVARYSPVRRAVGSFKTWLFLSHLGVSTLTLILQCNIRFTPLLNSKS